VYRLEIKAMLARMAIISTLCTNDACHLAMKATRLSALRVRFMILVLGIVHHLQVEKVIAPRVITTIQVSRLVSLLVTTIQGAVLSALRDISTILDLKLVLQVLGGRHRVVSRLFTEFNVVLLLPQ